MGFLCRAQQGLHYIVNGVLRYVNVMLHAPYKIRTQILMSKLSGICFCCLSDKKEKLTQKTGRISR